LKNRNTVELRSVFLGEDLLKLTGGSADNSANNRVFARTGKEGLD
jgi:hypothetical protein